MIFVLAIGAALAFGASAGLQKRASHEVYSDPSLKVGVMVGLDGSAPFGASAVAPARACGGTGERRGGRAAQAVLQSAAARRLALRALVVLGLDGRRFFFFFKQKTAYEITR